MSCGCGKCDCRPSSSLAHLPVGSEVATDEQYQLYITATGKPFGLPHKTLERAVKLGQTLANHCVGDVSIIKTALVKRVVRVVHK